MYIQGMAQQTQVFLLCVGFGFAAGICYSIMRFLRRTFFTGYRAAAVQDIVFFILLTFSSFIFMLCINDGMLRIYPYLGMTAGFFIWKSTLGVPADLLLGKVSAFIRKVIEPVSGGIKNFFRKTIKFIKKIANKPVKPLEKASFDSV